MSEAPVSDPPSDDALDRAGIEALAASLRRVIRHVRVTTAPTDVLERARRSLEEAASTLAPHDHPGPFAQGGLRSFFGPGSRPPWSGASAAEVFPYSPVVGPSNPIAPPIEFEVRGDEVHGTTVLDPQYSGPPGRRHGSVHGGVIALVMDELLGFTGVALQAGGFTGTLSVRYHALTPLCEELRLVGRLTRREGRKTFALGEVWHGETLTAQAEGVFIRPKSAP